MSERKDPRAEGCERITREHLEDVEHYGNADRFPCALALFMFLTAAPFYVLLAVALYRTIKG